MKKGLATLFLTLSLTGTVWAAEADVSETRSAVMETEDGEVEYEETLYKSGFGYEIWYPTEMVKPSEFGGNDCFIPVSAADAAESETKFIVVVEDDENAEISIESALASFEASGEEYGILEVGELQTKELGSGMTLESARVRLDKNIFYFYLLKDENGENLIYITSSFLFNKEDVYGAYFNKMAESIEMTETS